MDQNAHGSNAKKAVEPEILGPSDDFSANANWQARYQSQKGFSGVWVMPPVDRSGCISPAISFALFLICLGQFGVLAGLGFLVFYAIGAIAGGVHASRMLMEGKRYNMWAWRVGNWVISFILTVWLAGGFKN